MRPGTDKTPKNDDLEQKVKDLENFCEKLLNCLEQAELKIQAAAKDKNIYLIPSGTWFGKKYE